MFRNTLNHHLRSHAISKFEWKRLKWNLIHVMYLHAVALLYKEKRVMLSDYRNIPDRIDMKLHLIFAMQYYTPVWFSPYLVSITGIHCIHVLLIAFQGVYN